MVPLLLLPLLWRGSVQQYPGYQLRGQELVIVQEGLCVLVPCSFFYPRDARYGELYMYLFRDGDNLRRRSLVATNNPRQQGNTETQGRFRFLGDPRTDYCSLSIRDARRSDTGVYSLQLQRGHYVNYNYREKKLNLQVTDMTEKPDIHFPELLESGRPTNLTCSLPGSCDGGRPLTFSWVGDAFDSLDPGTLQSPWLTLTLRPQDHGTNLTCRVKLQGAQVTTERTIQLNVSYAPQNLTIRIFSRNVTELKNSGNGSCLQVLAGESLPLVCVANSNPPATLKWVKVNGNLSPSQVSKPGVLELSRIQMEHEGKFMCQAQNTLGHQLISLNLCVHYPPQLLGPSCSWEDEGLHCNCSSRAQPAASLHWWLGEEVVEGNHSNASLTVTSSSAGPWANSSLSLSRGFSSGLRFSCEAKNDHGAQNIAILLLPGKSVSPTGVLPAALGGAGAMALLSLSLCLILFCIMKARRKQAARKREGVDDEDPVMGTVAWGSKKQPQSDGPPDQACPAEDARPSVEEQELHYTSISFHEMKSWEPQDQDATSTNEYSEIRASK
ncbi:PREDICTED: sialic acid-binding Ig-like lectin 5 [Ceratotherium simum simum]|uniref:Sialic acid-binding Ig-like lectin 5 n=1 Tax=Ceratotherium simum simum TaxID=73337 RepID=A0ABM0I311_CERSS|nr:PREDICTED: sialic acid-binding Ig-like lectin 5 [Ceratotherium simum simum]